MDARELLRRMVWGAAGIKGGKGIARTYDEPHIERQHGEQLVQTLVDEDGICWRVAIQRVN